MPSPAITKVTFAIPCDRIHIPAVEHRNNRGAIRLHGRGGGFLEGEVDQIQRVIAGGGRIGIRLRFFQMDGAVRRRLSGHSIQIGIIIIVRILDHVNDLIFALGRVPLCVENGILLQRERRSCRLGAVRIRVPAVEGVARAGGIGGQSNRRTVGRRHRLDIVAAGNVVGKREVPAVVVDIGNHIIAGKRDVHITVIIVRIGIVFGVGRDGRVLHTDLGFRFDQGGIAAACQILQVMVHSITEVGVDIFVLHGECVYIVLLIQRPGHAVEAIFIDGDGRDRGIIQILAGDQIDDRGLRRRHGIAVLQVAVDELIHTRADIHLIAFVHIIIVNGKLVGGDGFE